MLAYQDTCKAMKSMGQTLRVTSMFRLLSLGFKSLAFAERKYFMMLGAWAHRRFMKNGGEGGNRCGSSPEYKFLSCEIPKK